ncbi:MULTISPECIES: hypothetical protein [Thioalkalivibrio]|uniref:hypothetical protein n=1 Tax=Thioalkalivibrio TaxID=106633 RepID=UPI0003635F0E
MIRRFAATVMVMAGASLAGCGQGGDPLDVQVETAREVFLGEGEGEGDGLLFVTVTLENHGTRAVHVLLNGVRLIPEGRDPSGYGSFIRHVSPVVEDSGASPEHTNLRATLEELGFDRAWLRAVSRNELAIEPGESVRERFGFRVDGPTGWGTLELRYHDDATDQFQRIRRPVRVSAEGTS